MSLPGATLKVEEDARHRAAAGEIGLLGVAAGNQEGAECFERGLVERLQPQGPVRIPRRRRRGRVSEGALGAGEQGEAPRVGRRRNPARGRDVDRVARAVQPVEREGELGEPVPGPEGTAVPEREDGRGRVRDEDRRRPVRTSTRWALSRSSWDAAQYVS